MHPKSFRGVWLKIKDSITLLWKEIYKILNLIAVQAISCRMQLQQKCKCFREYILSLKKNSRKMSSVLRIMQNRLQSRPSSSWILNCCKLDSPLNRTFISLNHKSHWLIPCVNLLANDMFSGKTRRRLASPLSYVIVAVPGAMYGY